jgi:hypothetical protein
MFARIRSPAHPDDSTANAQRFLFDYRTRIRLSDCRARRGVLLFILSETLAGVMAPVFPTEQEH